MILFTILLVFIGLAIGLAWYLLSHDRGEKEPIATLWLAVGLGVMAAGVAGFIESRVIAEGSLMPGAAHSSVMLAALGVGVIEEACKFLPLALWLYPKRYFNEHTDGIIYFALVGLGFGLPENLLYTVQYGTEAGSLRLLLTPLFHAAITGMVGYYLAKYKLAGRSRFAVLLPLAVAMLLHALYDFGLVAGTGFYAALALMITFGLSMTLFLLFLRANQRDQDKGISAVGHNDFCRSCGFPNPKHHLYCTNCGKNA